MAKLPARSEWDGLDIVGKLEELYKAGGGESNAKKNSKGEVKPKKRGRKRKLW